MKFSVCIDAVFAKGAKTDQWKDTTPFSNEYEKCAEVVSKLGYKAIEFWGYKHLDYDEVRKINKRLNLELSCFCTSTPSMIDVTKRDELIEETKNSIRAAKSMGCDKLICLVGQVIEGMDRDMQKQNIIEGLKLIAPYFEQADITLMIEALNTKINHIGYYLGTSAESFEILKAVESTHVKMIFDIYHMQISEGDIIRNIEENIEYIAHFHAAGNPGRNELDNGEINYNNIFKVIKELDYNGYMGLEYMPLSDPIDSLKKLL